MSIIKRILSSVTAVGFCLFCFVGCRAEDDISLHPEEGDAVVDWENQADMVNPEPVEVFCARAEAKQRGSVTLFRRMEQGGFARYDLETEEGKIRVSVRYPKEKEEIPESCYFREFEAEKWKYTENGYLFLAEAQMPGYDGPSGEIGIRVKPLDERLRAWNRRCVQPLGYAGNQLLSTNWSEADFGALDFYDLYERMYRMKYGEQPPYDGAFGGKEYAVPKKEFEEVLQTYLRIDSGEIVAHTVYDEAAETYRYRPRGLYDCLSPDPPRPEVVACEEQADGTVKLRVNGVWVREMEDAVLSSELTVRPLENGGMQYVSNRVISPPDAGKPDWYVRRLTAEEWDAHYGEDN